MEMDESGLFDIENVVHKFCVSWVALRVCQVGTTLFVQAWNNHRIPGTLNKIIYDMV